MCAGTYGSDKEGNLSKKVDTNGDTWFYAYYGNGMLKKVVKPDCSSVYFIYDPFGRRIEKAVSGAGSEKVLPKGEGTSFEDTPWVQVGGGFIRKPVKKKQDSNLDMGAEPSLYAEESREPQMQYQTVTRFLWSGDTLLHEWEAGEEGKRRLREREGEKADYILKMEEQADHKARAEADKGTEPPKNLITWVFQDDFIPRAKLTEDGSFSIISDYLGTPVEAYDGEGKKVWERELDIYGRVKKSQKDRFGKTTELVGEDGFIPFRYQGQYEDVETGLYYNLFRYYSPSDGVYTQIDPIGLTGSNPTIYAFVSDTNGFVDPLGLNPLNGAPFPVQDIVNGGCEALAKKVHKFMGGKYLQITSPYPALGSVHYSQGVIEGWQYHVAVIKDSIVYDGMAGSKGMPLNEYKKMFDYVDDINFDEVSKITCP